MNCTAAEQPCQSVACVPCGNARRALMERLTTERRSRPQPVRVRNFAPAPISLPLCEHLEDARGNGGCRHRKCSRGHGAAAGVKPCDHCGPGRCPDYLPLNGEETRPGLVPRWTHQFGAGLVPDRHQTNCSLMPFSGRLLLAYRTGWVGANIHIAEIHEDMTPGGSKTIRLPHPMCVGGREDPRLFAHDGAMHLSFIGVRLRQPGNHTVARQLFARLDNDLNAVRVWEPKYDRTTEWEKNWQPFSHDGRLFVVYSMRPWVVLELTGDLALPVSEATGVPWKFGLPRGGAAPVLHNGEWYAFFHGTDKSGYDRGLPAIYTTGVCTFESKPPFRPLRITREPILWPVMADLPKGPHGGKSWYAATAFPCGAYLDGDQWVVSYGHNDHWCRVSAFDAKQIEERLCPIK
ncbi:glycoside hydrolase family protein [Zavarzinella formosa]|uniref:hypothetical protein n=1 Tax=Zavarzinella formosa TaxID=360055 RepID=UPI0002FB508A|nr:hypothetical protein [Zavarzinella formosa]